MPGVIDSALERRVPYGNQTALLSTARVPLTKVATVGEPPEVRLRDDMVSDAYFCHLSPVYLGWAVPCGEWAIDNL